MKNSQVLCALVAGAGLVGAASAEILERPSGIKIGERMTLRPYVSLSLTYDSNVEAQSGDAHSTPDCLWTIAPSLALAYDAESWSLLLSGYYNFRQYFKSCYQNYNNHSYGEDLRWNWSNSDGKEKGWTLILGESFKQVTMADDMVMDGGEHYTGDTRQLQVAGAVQRRFNEYLHGDINADYYWLDYMNDVNNRYAYYGWDRWQVGMEAGFAPSQWTDFLLRGSYQGYNQDNMEGYRGMGESEGYTVQGGIGSFMTERISYRLLAGWSRFDYGKGASTSDGFVYTASANWKIGETWNTMLMATSYYQPSERQASSKTRVDAASWGLAKVMVRGKMRSTFDLRYRREQHEYLGDSTWDYTLDIVTARLGLSYAINRLFSVFGNIEYQRSWNDEADKRNGAYDYDRIRATVGMMLTY